MHQERSVAMQSVAYVTVVLFCVIALAPMVYIASTAFKETHLLFHYPPDWIQWPPYLGNILTLLTRHSYLRWTLNTLFIATCVSGLKLIMDSMAGYAFAKMQFPGKETVFVILLVGLMVPFAAALIPLYFMVRDFGMYNTYWALILPPLANPIGIFMMRQFIEGLPTDLDNAARLDGCSEIQLYRSVILPLIRPALVVLGVYLFMLQWTNFLWPLVVTNQSSMSVLTVGILSLKSTFTVNWGLISAGFLMAMVPISLIFLFAQRYFVATPLTGAIKE